MGNVCGGGGGGGNKDDAEKNKAINKALAEEQKNAANEVKLLLLGAGESGKSTVAKQMKIIHLKGFTTEERSAYKSIINNNIITSMRALVAASKELGVQISPQNKSAAERFSGAEEYYHGDLTQEIAMDVKSLWQDPGIKELYTRSSEFQLNDSAGYYFDNIDKIVKSDYLPDEQDILRSRAKTTGIVEISFQLENTKFLLVDVGGQRSERKKWMHCFQDVTAVLFCVALSEYDLKLYEDDTTNRMHESLKLFKEICNNKWFVETSIILFLNKKDLFEEKIKKSPLTIAFPEYKGDAGNKDQAIEFIKEKFFTQNENPKKQIYCHATCATDTSNIQVVFNAVKETILMRAVKQDFGL